MAVAFGRFAFAAVLVVLVFEMARFVGVRTLLGLLCSLRAVGATPINQDLVLLTWCHNFCREKCRRKPSAAATPRKTARVDNKCVSVVWVVSPAPILVLYPLE